MPGVIKDGVGNRPDDLYQFVTWPGAGAIESCSYTNSHGISPGVAVLTTIPRDDAFDAAPAVFGNLVFGDGHRAVTLYDCRLDTMSSSRGPGGLTWTLMILDRRWRWRTSQAAYGALVGHYNRMDNRGKLIPDTIRSPEELAKLCFAEMGETGYAIDLPKAQERKDGANLDRYLRLGENFPMSFANPEMVWDYTPPGNALQQLVDYFGRRIAFRYATNTVAIVPLGVGEEPSPSIPYESVSPGLDIPKTPKAVGVAGAPIRYQGRFLLEAVGEEFDGSCVPINQLSYAPRGPGKKQITTVTAGAGPLPGVQLTIRWTDAAGNDHILVGDSKAREQIPPAQFTEIITAWQASPDAGLFTFSAAGSVLTVAGNADAFSFDVFVSARFNTDPGDNPNPYPVATPQQAKGGGGSWLTCPPPVFFNVQATDRLSYGEAVALAQKSVFKWFRIKLVDPADPTKRLSVPGFGAVDRRHQIIVQETKVQQIVPQPRIASGVNAGNPIPFPVAGQGILPDYYNGYSQDRPATVHGAVFKFLNGTSVFWDIHVPADGLAKNMNTKSGDRVYIGHAISTVDSGDQVVAFSDFVYKWVPNDDASTQVEEPRLILETACLMRDGENGQINRVTRTLDLGGEAPTEWRVQDDIQVGYVGVYQGFLGGSTSSSGSAAAVLAGTANGGAVGTAAELGANRLVRVDKFNEQDATDRSAYYLAGMAKKYQLTGGGTKHLVGVWPVNPDGLVQQVTISVGDGATTVVGVNNEPSPVVPPYPARRLRENLPPDKAAAAANLAERAKLGVAAPRVPGAVRP